MNCPPHPDHSIATRIDRDFVTVSVLEDTRQVLAWLEDRPYYAVMDEALRITGIVTRDDLQAPMPQQLIDLELNKPAASPTDTLIEVEAKMLNYGLTFLPVYERLEFIGVISLSALGD